MSPAKTPPHDHHHRNHHIGQTTLNGLRPSPLRVNKMSHSIHKSSNSTSSSSSNSNSNSSTTSAAAGASAGEPVIKTRTQQQQQQQQPVIIYTHSPKVIHTQPKDFMALVQKLTGRSGAAGTGGDGGNSGLPVAGYRRESSEMKASSISGEDDHGGGYGGCGGGDRVSAAAVPGHTHNLFADIPLFTPNSSSTNFFCSPKPVFRYPDPAGNLLSPSVFEFMRGLPEFN